MAEFDVENYLSNLSYINKDFQSLWAEILETIPKLTNKWKPDESTEADPLVVLLKELAIMTDKLDYNMDKTILELFPKTLTQLRSAYNVYDSLGYNPDWYISATTDITFNYNGMVGTEILQSSSFTDNPTFDIPRFTAVSDDDSAIVYTTMGDVTFNLCEVSKRTITAMEGTATDHEINGSKQILFSNLDSENRLYLNNTHVAQNGIFISNYEDFSDAVYNAETDKIEKEGLTVSTVSSVSSNEHYDVWTRVDNLNRYLSGNKVYKLCLEPTTGNVYLQFPQDASDLIEDGIYIRYIVSSGEQGNIGQYDLTKFLNAFEASVADNNGDTYTVSEENITVTNTKSSQNGTDPLTIEEMYKHFNRIVGIFNTLVTLRDYENYIYEYTDSTGANVVSNIKVADRYNDLTDSLVYKYLGSNNQVFKDTITLESEVALTDDESERRTMTAYDLKLYPLQPMSSIDSKEEFNVTFNLNDDGTAFIADLGVINEQVQNAVAASKCISHDFVNPGYPILIPYDLSGQVYLKNTVSSIDAMDVLTNVEYALYENLNARELTWGRGIQTTDVVDIITKADNRIQYVGLDSITYDEPLFYPSAEGFLDNGYDVIERSILNGSVAWTTYAPYVFDYGMEFSYIGVSERANDPGYLTNLTSVTTYVEISNTNIADTYIVNTNETFTIIVPQYQTITTYSNYLYVLAYGQGDEGIKADTPTTLDKARNQTLYVYESRTDALNDIENYNSGVSSKFPNADYKIKSGTIVKTNLNIDFKTSGFTEDDLINLGSASAIDIIEKAEGYLQASNAITGVDSSAKLYIATNSHALIDAFESATNREYTLLSDEYLFYTDEMGSELGIIGEGTTLNPSEEIVGVYYIDSTSSLNSLINGNIKAASYTAWTVVNSGKIAYTLNNLFTFGANYVVNIQGEDSGVEAFSEYAQNKFFDLPKDVVVKYQLAEVTKSDDANDDADANVTTISKLIFEDGTEFTKSSTRTDIYQHTLTCDSDGVEDNNIELHYNNGYVDIAYNGKGTFTFYDNGTAVLNFIYETDDGSGVKTYQELSFNATYTQVFTDVFMPTIHIVGEDIDAVLKDDTLELHCIKLNNATCIYGKDREAGIDSEGNIVYTNYLYFKVNEKPTFNYLAEFKSTTELTITDDDGSINIGYGHIYIDTDINASFLCVSYAKDGLSYSLTRSEDENTFTLDMYKATIEYTSKIFTIDEDSWEEVEKISPNDTYKVLIRLMLLTGPGVEQTLTNSESFVLKNDENEDDDAEETSYTIAQTTQAMSITEEEYGNLVIILSTDDITDEVSVQASVLLTSEGGTTLYLSAEDEINMLYYVGSVNTSNYNSDGFIQLKNAETGELYVTSLDVPGTREVDIHDCAVIPYMTEDAVNTVKYCLVKGGSVLEFETNELAFTITSNGTTTTITTNAFRNKGSFTYIVRGTEFTFTCTDLSKITNGEMTSDDEITFTTSSSDIYAIINGKGEGGIYYIDDTRTAIQYATITWAYTNNTASHSTWMYIGRPYLVTRNAVYYDKKGTAYGDTVTNYPPVYMILYNGSTYLDEMELTEDYIYYKYFCPLITPSATDLIDDPTESKSYFLSQHPYNKFTLPWLRSIENLTINPANLAS